MPYKTLMFLHLYTVLPCVVLGAVSFLLKKGSPYHKYVGSSFMLLMLFTATVSLFIPAYVGPTLFKHFGFIHSFSILTLFTIPRAYVAIKRGDVKAHKRRLIGLYIGAIGIAGAFTFWPGRYMYNWVFG